MTRRKPQDDSFVEYIADQLDAIDGITHRSMFGGHGLYCGSTFFGIVYKDRLYFKTDDRTRRKYDAWGMEPFQPNATQTLKSYFEVPEDYVEDREKLTELAEEAIEVAANAK